MAIEALAMHAFRVRVDKHPPSYSGCMGDTGLACARIKRNSAKRMSSDQWDGEEEGRSELKEM